MFIEEMTSVGDDVGRVFHQDGRIYRGIRKEYEESVEEDE